MDFRTLPPDRTNATYQHILKMVTGVEIVGYSKKEGRNEPADKRALLMGTIARLLPKYVESGLYIGEFYRQRITGPSNITKELILEMTPTHFQLHGYLANDYQMRRFLNAFYAGDVDAVQGMLSRKSGSEEFKFDPKTQNEADLLAICQRLVNFYDRHRVELFYHACTKLLQTGGANTRTPATRRPATEATPLSSIIHNLIPKANE